MRALHSIRNRFALTQSKNRTNEWKDEIKKKWTRNHRRRNRNYDRNNIDGVEGRIQEDGGGDIVRFFKLSSLFLSRSLSSGLSLSLSLDLPLVSRDQVLSWGTELEQKKTLIFACVFEDSGNQVSQKLRRLTLENIPFSH